MSQFKPLITIEFEEYNNLKKYIDTLEKAMGEENPYKRALKEIIESLLLKGGNYYEGLRGDFADLNVLNNSSSNLIISIINKHGVTTEINRDREVTLSLNIKN